MAIESLEETLAVMRQLDLLTIATRTAQQEEYRYVQAKVGALEPIDVTNSHVGYSCVGHVGQKPRRYADHTHLAVVSYNFFVNTIERRFEWQMLMEDMAAKADVCFGILAERVKSRDGHSDVSLRICFVTSLVPPNDNANSRREVIEPLTEHLTALYQTLDARARAAGLVGDWGRVHLSLWNHKDVALRLESDEDVKNVLAGYERLVFEISPSGALGLSSALLGGIHAVGETPHENNSFLGVASFLRPLQSGTVSAASLAELEALINSTRVREADFQKYFERFPSLLLDGTEYRVLSQVVLRREDGSTLRPDFFLAPLSKSGHRPVILDLKLPQERVVPPVA